MGILLLIVAGLAVSGIMVSDYVEDKLPDGVDIDDLLSGNFSDVDPSTVRDLLQDYLPKQASEADDVLTGGSGDDAMTLLAGDDVAFGWQGNDWIDAGSGNDVVAGGAGKDTLLLGSGEDIYAPLPTEGFSATAGHDIVYGGGGDDWIIDDRGANQLYGDAGSDTLASIDGPDSDGGRDVLYGGAGADRLWADGQDILFGGAGEDDFAVWVDDPSDVNVTVSDYDTTSDDITVYVPDTSTLNERSLTVADQNGDATVQLAGQTIMTVRGGAGLGADDVEFVKQALPDGFS